MTCSDFIQGFSEYFDGEGSSAFIEGAEEHLAHCEDCRRYVRVFDRGRSLLQSFGTPQLSEDFRPRLQHRIYHLADEQALARVAGKGSGATAATALGMAVLLVFAAWSPALVSARPDVQLAPIVVSRPEPRPVRLRPRPIRLRPSRGDVPFMAPLDLWGQPNDLLFEHSPLNAPGGQPRVRRADLD